MQRNYFLIRSLANALNTKLRGFELDNAFSTGKSDLFLVFRKQNTFFYIRLSFEAGQVFFRFPENLALPSRAMPWFKDAWTKEVESVYCPFGDRKLIIRFRDAHLLYFRLYPPKPDVLFGMDGNTNVEAFRHRKDSEILSFQEASGSMPELPAEGLKDEKELLKIFPFFKGEIAEKIAAEGFYEKDESKQKSLLEKLLEYLIKPKFYAGKYKNGSLRLSLFEFPAAFVFMDVLKALDRFSSDFLRDYYLRNQKEQLLKAYEAVLRKLQKSKQAALSRSEELKHEIPLEEKANILMANLHAIENGAETVKLHDFYRDKEISLKLNPKLNAQQNAEVLYRKAKNRHIEVEELNKKLDSLDQNIREHQEKLELIRSSDDRNLLKSLSIKSGPAGEEEYLPYREFELMGWAILVGKNAKANDELISRYAKKNDTWLHARNFAGSHVIIRQQAGKVIPRPVLERAASLAAYYSKGKSESLCPVIYTERKYVRKPRGAAPGQVLVEKEQVIMVKPATDLN